MAVKTTIPDNTVKLWQIRCGVVSAVVLAALASFLSITLWMLVPVVVIFVLSLVFILWYVPTFLKSHIITADDSAVTVKRGVFIKTEHIMPFPRLVYSETFSTPLSERMGISGISLRAARGVILIPEIKKSDTELLLEYMARTDND